MRAARKSGEMTPVRAGVGRNISSAMGNNMSFEQTNYQDSQKNKRLGDAGFFARQLDQNKISPISDVAIKEAKMREDAAIYQENISDNLKFEVCTNGQFLSFYLTDESGQHLANFKYNRVGDKLSQEHREIDDSLLNYGINGSLFLQKVEEFLTIMVNKSKEKIDEFFINSGQTSVINWAIKNGYHFKNKEQEEMYSNVLKDSEKYVISDEFKNGNKYQNYIFQKDNLSKAKDFLEGELNKGEDRDSIDLKDFSERFQLVKDIKVEN